METALPAVGAAALATGHPGASLAIAALVVWILSVPRPGNRCVERNGEFEVA